jgi:hypothetical protein
MRAPDASTLYTVSSEFRSLIALWETEGRCPVPLVDYLLEHDLTAAAEACRWAATEPKRRGASRLDDERYPGPAKFQGQFYWVASSSYSNGTPCYVLSPARIGHPVGWGTNRFDSFGDAVIWLLDHWRP